MRDEQSTSVADSERKDSFSVANSFKKPRKCTTTPFPMRQCTLVFRIPDGIRWNLYFLSCLVDTVNLAVAKGVDQNNLH